MQHEMAAITAELETVTRVTRERPGADHAALGRAPPRVRRRRAPSSACSGCGGARRGARRPAPRAPPLRFSDSGLPVDAVAGRRRPPRRRRLPRRRRRRRRPHRRRRRRPHRPPRRRRRSSRASPCRAARCSAARRRRRRPTEEASLAVGLAEDEEARQRPRSVAKAVMTRRWRRGPWSAKPVGDAVAAYARRRATRPGRRRCREPPPPSWGPNRHPRRRRRRPPPQPPRRRRRRARRAAGGRRRRRCVRARVTVRASDGVAAVAIAAYVLQRHATLFNDANNPRLEAVAARPPPPPPAPPPPRRPSHMAVDAKPAPSAADAPLRVTLDALKPAPAARAIAAAARRRPGCGPRGAAATEGADSPTRHPELERCARPRRAAAAGTARSPPPTSATLLCTAGVPMRS